MQNGRKVTVLSGLMLRYQKPDIISKSDNKLSVIFYLDATAAEITDHLRPAIKKKPDAITLHADTNCLTNDVNTMKLSKSDNPKRFIFSLIFK